MRSKGVWLAGQLGLLGLVWLLLGDAASEGPLASSAPRVCILMATTSRGRAWKTFAESAPAQFPLSSMGKTLEKEYRYELYLGYDDDDAFFSRPGILKEARQFVEKHVPEVKLQLKSFRNEAGKPGPAMNFLAQEAFNDGCDYFYRVNDDTSFVTQNVLKELFQANKMSVNPFTQTGRWTSLMIAELAKMKPPNIGVVGPRVLGTSENSRILTHDFVSRRHLQIFGIYYPKVFPDWYLDNWISLVYGERNTRKLKTVLVMHSGGDETRYSVSLMKRKAIQLLRKTVREGRAQLKRFINTYTRYRAK